MASHFSLLKKVLLPKEARPPQESDSLTPRKQENASYLHKKAPYHKEASK